VVSALVRFNDVSVVFGGTLRALDHVSFSMARGEIVGLVGESGSGKTTLCKVLMGLAPATSGQITIGDETLTQRLARDTLGFRRMAQMLQQDSVASLSPRMRIGALVEEPLRIHAMPMEAGRTRMRMLMQRLGLPASTLDKYPHQISGGQARRVAILRALMLGPELIVADEPTAGLDVSVQGDLLNLLLDLYREMALTYLIVSHNLNVIRRITTRTMVMYLGEIVEDAPTQALFHAPAHPYSSALLSTNPIIDPTKRRQRIVLQGDIPSPINPPSGCRFHTRCPQMQDRCRTEHPVLRDHGAGRRVSCHFPLDAPAIT
jgi:peptide/nickel transport system ATP-binding protein